MRIFVAGDAKPPAAGAVRLAARLAAEAGADVEVVRVLEPVPTQGPGAVGTLSFGRGDGTDDRVAASREETRRWLREVSPEAADWLVVIAAGPAPLAIVEEAQRSRASLIFIGAGRHDRFERWLGTETALRVMQLAQIPVVAVPAEGGDRPSTIVAAIDFSDFAVDALETALEVASPTARIHLAHALWYPREGAPARGNEDWYEADRQQSLERLREWAASIDALQGRSVELHLLEGQVADEVVALAERVGADLLAAGSHGRGFFGRAMLGSVATGLIRRAACAVLIAPPRASAQEG
jgi:nucleotide-binding universal stress UspA family protein